MAHTHEPPQPDWSRFCGFRAPTYTQTPDAFFDWIAPFLSDPELRVLIYLIRRTFGFKREYDAVSIEQLCTGIIKHSGERLDYGTQLSRATVMRGVKGLREKNLIIAHQREDARGSLPTEYAVNMRDDGPEEREVLRAVFGGGLTRETPVSQRARTGGIRGETPGGSALRPTRDSDPKDRPTTDSHPGWDALDADAVWAAIAHDVAELLPAAMAHRALTGCRGLASPPGQLRVGVGTAQQQHLLERALGRKIADAMGAYGVARIEYVLIG